MSDKEEEENAQDDESAAADKSSLADDDKKRRKRKRKRKPTHDDAHQDDEPAVDNDQEKDAATKEQEVDRTVFVEGIPYDCTPADVSDFFQQHLATALATTTDNDNNSTTMITDCRLPTWPDTGRLKGYGHVVFATRELQQAACSLTTKRLYLKKRYLSIAPAHAPGSKTAAPGTPLQGGAPSKTIVLHNLSYDATEDDISQVLANRRIVQGGVRVVRHNATKRSRGFAYVEFESIEDAQAATAEPILVLGRPCRVDYDHGQVQKSFRTDTGRLWHKSYGGGNLKDKRQRPS
jgi:nucleolin